MPFGHATLAKLGLEPGSTGLLLEVPDGFLPLPSSRYEEGPAVSFHLDAGDCWFDRHEYDRWTNQRHPAIQELVDLLEQLEDGSTETTPSPSVEFPEEEDFAKDEGPYDFAIVFAKQRSDLALKLWGLFERLRDQAAIWIAWPRRSSGIPTDLGSTGSWRMLTDSGFHAGRTIQLDDVWNARPFRFVA